MKFLWGAEVGKKIILTQEDKKIILNGLRYITKMMMMMTGDDNDGKCNYR